MKPKFLLFILTLLGLAAILATALTTSGNGAQEDDEPAANLLPGQPQVRVLTPRNGSRHQNNSVVVRVAVDNFELAPLQLGKQPQLAEGHIKFSLNRVPNCVDPEKLRKAQNDPRGSGRLKGRSFDYPEYSGINGLLAERIGSAGSYSPATQPEIFYTNLPRGFYRLVITLARNDGASTPAHAVTTFEILPEDGKLKPIRCKPGQVPAAKAAARLSGAE